MSLPAIWNYWADLLGRWLSSWGSHRLLPTVSLLPIFLVEVCSKLPPPTHTQLHCSLKEEERRCDWQAASFENCGAYVPWAKLSQLSTGQACQGITETIPSRKPLPDSGDSGGSREERNIMKAGMVQLLASS